MISERKYLGCFRGLAIADSFGASYEGGVLERLLWRMIGSTKNGLKRYTDDTQMSIDIAESYLDQKRINQDHLADTFASSYRWSRGYGPGASKLLNGVRKGIHWKELNRKKFKDGSMGNGAAMRAPIIALIYPSVDKTLSSHIKKCSEITHAHPDAIEGALIIAKTTCMALSDCSKDEILKFLISESQSQNYASKLETCNENLLSNRRMSSQEIRSNFGNNILAINSCVTSLYFALSYREQDFESMLVEIFGLGGDTDTIAAMAGGIWGAFNGDDSINHLAKKVENMKLVESLASRLYHSAFT